MKIVAEYVLKKHVLYININEELLMICLYNTISYM